MRVSFLCENVNKKLSFVNHAVSNRAQLPILLNFLFKAGGGKLTVSATDLEIGIEATLAANIEEEGSVTVPAKTFFEILSAINKGKVILYTKENNLHFETDKIKTTFQTIKADEFPKIYEEKGEKVGEVSSEMASTVLPSVVFSAALDTGRPALSGVLLGKTKGKNNNFFMAATDGFRMSLKKDSEEIEEKEYLVPSRILREIISLKEESGFSIFVSGKNNQIIFEQDDLLISGRLIEDKFPNFQKIIPQDFSLKAVVDREELLQAVKTCSVFAREAANIVRFSLEKNKIIISASAPSLGETSVEVEAVLEGEENEIAFNARYVLEFLSNVVSEKIIFEMTGPLNPGVFKIEKDPSYLHIIMPIRVQTNN
jgi:DNA polymerase-3 subunit beta